MADPLIPKATLLIKLGSLIIHAQECLSPDGRNWDKDVFNILLADPEVQAWLKEMDALTFLPKRRIE